MIATTRNNDEIAERIKAVRSFLSENQKDFASKLEVGFSTYQKYEMGMSIPGGEAIKGFVRVGINANWLLTGEGEMLLSDIQAHPAPPDTPYATQEASLHAHQRVTEPEAHYHVRDLGVLHTAILLAEEASAVQSLSVDQRAELILSFYNRLSKSPAK